jgi:phage tail sheath protein FI
MPSYFTPGVWFETLDRGAQPIDPLRTDIAAFIGVAERGRLDVPVRVNSIEQFRSEFGELIPNALLAYSVKAFFENGGRSCSVVRVAAPLTTANSAGVQPPDRLSSLVTSTAGFAAGAAATITQTVVTATAGVQPPDRASSIASSVDGFTQRSLVRVTQGGKPTTYHHIAAVDVAAKTIVWDSPLDGAYNLLLPITLTTTRQIDRLIASVSAGTLGWTRPLDDAIVLAGPIQFASGTSVASFDLIDDAAQPTLRLTASSPGAWGNLLTVLVVRTNLHSTRTDGAQPPHRMWSIVDSVVGFETGTVVRLDQQGLAGEVHAVVSGIDASERQIFWTAALDAALDLTAAGATITIESSEFALSVYENGTVRETFEALSLEASNKDHYAPAVIAASSAFIRLENLQSVTPAPHNFPDAQFPALENGRATLRGGRDGIAALSTRELMGDRGSDERRGLRTLEVINDVSAIAVPDILIERVPPVDFVPPPKPLPPDECDPCAVLPPAVADPPPPRIDEQTATFTIDDVFRVQQAIVEHCERMRDRIALLDPPNFKPTQLAEIRSWRRRFDSSYAALYYPWVIALDPAARGTSLVRAIPPSGHVLGIYSRSDQNTGVHKAPANEELQWAQDLTIEVSPELQGLLNPMGINAIRPFAGRGLRVYGARTVSSDASWRFVNVRRLFIMIERALEKSLQWAVFEPNDSNLRQKITLAISAFLTGLWQRGALAGQVAGEAFFVRCNDANNPPDLQAAGQMLAEVGVAPVTPAEFVVLRIGRVEDALQVTEAVEGAAA